MSRVPFPKRFETSAIAANCSLLANPLGMRIRIMNLPGVGFRKKTPTHFNNSLSEGVRVSHPSFTNRDRSSLIRSGLPSLDCLYSSIGFAPSRI